MRLRDPFPIDLRGPLLYFLPGHDFPQQLQVLQGDDGGEILPIAADDDRPLDELVSVHWESLPFDEIATTPTSGAGNPRAKMGIR